MTLALEGLSQKPWCNSITLLRLKQRHKKNRGLQGFYYIARDSWASPFFFPVKIIPPNLRVTPKRRSRYLLVLVVDADDDVHQVRRLMKHYHQQRPDNLELRMPTPSSPYAPLDLVPRCGRDPQNLEGC